MKLEAQEELSQERSDVGLEILYNKKIAVNVIPAKAGIQFQ
jgi:hypothetical protein